MYILAQSLEEVAEVKPAALAVQRGIKELRVKLGRAEW